MSTVDPPAQHVCHSEGPLVLVSPGGSPAPRNLADLLCLAASEPVSCCAGVSEFFGLFPDGTQSCGKDHVQERSFGDSLYHNDASKVRKRIALRGLRSKTLQIGKITLSERQALADLGWLVESTSTAPGTRPQRDMRPGASELDDRSLDPVAALLLRVVIDTNCVGVASSPGHWPRDTTGIALGLS
jgi:hypothetical protein